MRIKIKCPNSQCGKTLLVDAEMAGKKGKCSTCNSVFLIPGALKSAAEPDGGTVDLSESPSGELEPDGKSAASSTTGNAPKRTRPRPGSGESKSSKEKYLDDYVEQPKPRKTPPPRAERRSAKEERDYEDYEDYDDDRESRPRRPPRKRSGGRDEFYDEYEDDVEYADYSRGSRRNEYDDEDRYEEAYHEEEYYEDRYEDSYGDAPSRVGGGGRGRRNQGGPKLGLIRAGVMILAIAGCVTAGAIGIKMLSELIGILSSSGGDTTLTLWKISELIWLGASIAVLVGYSFLLFFPNKNASLGLTIAALSVGSVNVLLMIFLKIVPLFSDRGIGGFGMMGLGLLSGSRLEFMLKMGLIEALFIAELVLVALAMSAINTQLKDRYNVQMAKRMIIPAGIYGGVILVFGMFILILSESRPGSPTAATIWKWVLYLFRVGGHGMLIWYFVSYILLMFNTRNAIPKR